MIQPIRAWKSIIFAALLLLPAAVHAQTGTLAPVPQQVFLDNSGNPLNAGTVTFYLAGTTTPTTTWSDQALTAANTNPIVLNSAGRNPAGGIYLSTAILYKVVVKTAAGATVYTQDNISAVLSASVASSDNGTCDGRLTLTTAVPVTTSDVTAATTVYFTPYRGNRCSLYDGSSTWSITSFSELSIALGSDAADTNNDVFLYLSSGTPTLERVAWTNATTRATALTVVNGVYVKSSDTTRRYLGTYRTTGSVGQTEDSLTKRFVWNMHHRVQRALRRLESTDTWTYTTAAYRQANASTSNQVAVVVGLAESLLNLSVRSTALNTNISVLVSVSIGADSASAASAGALMQTATTAVANIQVPVSASLVTVPTIGYHFYAWLEYSTATGTTTWVGDAGSPSLTQNGIAGSIDG